MTLTPNTVGIWRNRFAMQGMNGLNDQARSGKPSTYNHPALLQHLGATGNAAAGGNEYLGWRLARGKFERVR